MYRLSSSFNLDQFIYHTFEWCAVWCVWCDIKMCRTKTTEKKTLVTSQQIWKWFVWNRCRFRWWNKSNWHSFYYEVKTKQTTSYLILFLAMFTITFFSRKKKTQKRPMKSSIVVLAQRLRTGAIKSSSAIDFLSSF